MCEQYLAHLFSISLNYKESRQTGTQPITIFRIFAEKKRFFCSFVKCNSNICKIHIHMCKVQKRGKDCADKTAQGAGAHGA